MRPTSAATTTTVIAALLCNDKTRTVTVDDVGDLGTRDVTNNSVENHEGSIAFHHAKRARCEEGDKDRAVVELPSSTRVTNRTSIREKRFCSSCKHNLDAMTYFLENRKTCATCLRKKRELYEKRRRRVPSSTRVTNRTSIRKTKTKRFCTSCKHNLDTMTYFLKNRKTCTTCLTKHKLYEERRRRQHKAND